MQVGLDLAVGSSFQRHLRMEPMDQLECIQLPHVSFCALSPDADEDASAERLNCRRFAERRVRRTRLEEKFCGNTSPTSHVGGGVLLLLIESSITEAASCRIVGIGPLAAFTDAKTAINVRPPDITGSHFQKGWKSSVPVTSGALTGEIGTEWVGGQTSAGGKAYGVSLKASLSSNLFGRSATVQPRAGSFLMCVKI